MSGNMHQEIALLVGGLRCVLTSSGACSCKLVLVVVVKLCEDSRHDARAVKLLLVRVLNHLLNDQIILNDVMKTNSVRAIDYAHWRLIDFSLLMLSCAFSAKGSRNASKSSSAI